MVDELSKRVNELNAKPSELESRLSQLKPLEDVSKAVSALRRDVDELFIRINNISTSILELKDAMDLIRSSVWRRLRDCMYIDGDGYCTMWYWFSRVEGWDMREGVSGGGGSTT
jgi:predicted RNase H-like nuclease (RuvC/YqgF family)